MPVQVGGRYWSVPLGRKDGFVSSMAEANTVLPSPFMTFPQLVLNFAAVGLNVMDLVILSGTFLDICYLDKIPIFELNVDLLAF